ncbi:MAG TPA: hypothetical protein VHC44_04790 [Verrucomicrobiae bacterium]|nr:hypothetical protein [Verrucomicrobiae bacterium]
MRVEKVRSKEFQFYIPDLDNIVLVKSHADGTVTVRATKANCSDARKTAFIRRLAAEGFIPDEYQWLSGSIDETKGIRWIKDISWLKISPVIKQRSNRFMARLLVGAGIIWLAMMRVLLVSHPGHLAEKAGQISPPAIAGALPAK